MAQGWMGSLFGGQGGGLFGQPQQASWKNPDTGQLVRYGGATPGGAWYENPQLWAMLGNLGAGMLANNKPGSTFGQSLGGGMQYANEVGAQQEEADLRRKLYGLQEEEFGLKKATAEGEAQREQLRDQQWNDLFDNNPDLFSPAVVKVARAMGPDKAGTVLESLLKPPEAPKTREVRRGNQQVTEEWNPQTGWTVVGEGVAFAPPQPPANISVNTGSRWGTIPEGYALKEGPQGLSMEPIAGGPVAKSEAVRGEAQGKAADVVVNNLNRLESLVKKAPIPVTGMGSVLNIPGFPARDANKLADTVKANIGFDRLQEMRNASQTGGALGQVAIQELDMLQSVLGSLDMSQSQEQVLENIRQIKGLYTSIQTKLDIIKGMKPKTPADEVQSNVPSTSDYDATALKRKYGLE